MIRNIVLAKKHNDAGFERNRSIVKCVTQAVQSDTSIGVTGRPGYVWVREWGINGSMFQVFNSSVQDRAGVPVLVGYQPKPPYRRMIIDVDWDTYANLPGYSGNPYIPNHHASHEWPDNNPAPDVVNVYQRALVPLRAQQYTGLEISVAPAIYMYDGIVYRFNGDTVDLTAYVPVSTDYRTRILVYLDMVSNSLFVISGGSMPDYVEPGYPDLPVNSIASAWILLSYGDTVVLESMITDARSFMSGNSVYSQNSMLQQLAILEAEYDFALTKHIVEG